jgi:hypothetical protein
MNSLLKDIPVSGIIEQGQCYVLDEFEGSMFLIEPIDCLYVITSEQEIVRALDMTMCIIFEEAYEVRAFLGCLKISRDCHQFKMRCFDKQEDTEIDYSLYLHRIRSFEEELARVTELFGEE